MSESIDSTKPFRLLPELDNMHRQISDLELEQTRLEAARARDARREGAVAAVARAKREAEESHEAVVRNNEKASDSNRKSAEEIEAERESALRCAASAEDAFAAEYEAAWSCEKLNALLGREEHLMVETKDISEEARRFAHFQELGVVASPVARAAIYHLWDVDARNQPCRCAHCGVILLLPKQYIGDKLVEVFCAKCTAEHHRDQLFRDNLDLQEFYLKRTFDRIDERFMEDALQIEQEEEPLGRRAVACEAELQWQLIIETRFKKGPIASSALERVSAAKSRAAALLKQEPLALGLGVLAECIL